LKRRTDCPEENEKKLLKQRLDFPFDQRIETMDRLLTVQGQKIVETTVRFSL